MTFSYTYDAVNKLLYYVDFKEICSKPDIDFKKSIYKIINSNIKESEKVYFDIRFKHFYNNDFKIFQVRKIKIRFKKFSYMFTVYGIFLYILERRINNTINELYGNGKY